MKKNIIHKVLDYGEIELIDYMGDDKRICSSARVSTRKDKEEKTLKDDKNLIFYLMKNGHTSPFEHIEFEFRIKTPIFIARQWMRHRMASYNEISGRYSILPTEFYTPTIDRIKGKGKINKQGSEGEINEDIKTAWLQSLEEIYSDDQDLYEWANDENISNELARITLPVSTYTEFYWKINLHNLFHFLKLRLHEHAQWEIQEYAKIIYEIIKPIVPVACEAFEEFELYGVKLSRTEWENLTESAKEIFKNYMKNI